MSSPSVVVSFSEADSAKVRELFAGLGVQSVDVWDYSDPGQELLPGEPLKPALKAKIDSCDYFLAIISDASIDQNRSTTPFFEVRYAIDSGKAKDRVIPIPLDDPPPEWESLYPELIDLVWLPINTTNDVELEDAVRRICERLSIDYTPPALLDPAVFFAEQFLKELRSRRIKRAAFVQLERHMASAGKQLLRQDENDRLWTAIKESVISFFGGASFLAPEAQFFYPHVIRGVAELQLREFPNAEKTFQTVTRSTAIEPEWLGLAYAGLGHTYFLTERFNEAASAFQSAVELLPEDKHLRVNYHCALVYAGCVVLDDATNELLKDPDLPYEDRIKLIAIEGVTKYKRCDFAGTIQTFRTLDADDLNETATIYYAFALRELGQHIYALDVLENAARRIKSGNLYHFLADAYLNLGDIPQALKIYETDLWPITNPAEFMRQVLVEYAQLIRRVDGSGSKFRKACERVINSVLSHPPQTKPDFFYSGFAFHLLGDAQSARRYFDRSEDFCSQYYDELDPEN